MTLKDNWLSDVLSEVREQVDQWPEWKRSDEVRRELRKLDEDKRDVSMEGSARSGGLKTKDG